MATVSKPVDAAKRPQTSLHLPSRFASRRTASCGDSLRGSNFSCFSAMLAKGCEPAWITRLGECTVDPIEHVSDEVRSQQRVQLVRVPMLTAQVFHGATAVTRGGVREGGTGRIVLGDAKSQGAAVGREKAPQRPILPVDVPEHGACDRVPDQRLQKGRAVVGAFQCLSPDTRQIEDRRDALGNVDP